MSNGIAVPFGLTLGEGGAGDPLAGLVFAFRGYGLPVGASTDTAGTTQAVADELIANWKDNAGTAFTRATSGERPTLKDLSGSWAARFDGTNDFLARSNISLAGDFSIFVRQATTGDCCLVGNNGSNEQHLRIGRAGANILSLYDGVTEYFSSTLSASRGVSNVVGVIRSGSTITFYEGVATRGTGTMSASLSAGVIGAVDISGIQVLKTTGDIYAVLIAQSAMTAAVPQIVAALDAL